MSKRVVGEMVREILGDGACSWGSVSRSLMQSLVTTWEG
jgi:hypothetical protein